MTLHYSLLTASTNQAKTLSLVDGKIVKSSLANATSGRFTAHSVESLNEFAQVLNSITVKQSLIIGSVVRKDGIPLAVGEKIGLCLKGKENDKSVSRSKDFIQNLPVAGFMLFDIDGSSGNFSDLQSFIHEFVGVGAVVKPSSSSLIYDKNGNELVGEKGRHIFVPVKNMADIPRVADILWARMWIAGYGFHLVSAGIHPMLLERGLFDRTVLGKSERLAFEAKPILHDGLIQKYNHAVVIDGDILDTSIIKDLTSEETAQYHQSVKESAQKIRPDYEKTVEIKKREYIASGKSLADYESLNRRELPPDFEVNTSRGVFKVCDLSAEHDRLTMADPFEPDYDGGSTTKAIFFWNKGFPKINSKAHGGIVYKILKKNFVKVIEENNGVFSLDTAIDKQMFKDVTYNEKGKIDSVLPTLSNLRIMLSLYGITPIYDEAIKRQQIIISNDKSMAHDMHSEICIQRIVDLSAINQIHHSIVDRLAILIGENTINPVKDWIFSKPWDGVSRLNNIMHSLVVAIENRELSDKIIRTWLVQCVAALDKGVIGCKKNPYARAKYELILVLQGDQGLTKTKWFTKLLPTELNGERFSNRYIKDGSNLQLDNKDSIKQNISCWINELGELDATFKKSDISQLKAFCSNQKDTIRLPYARTECDFLRSTSFGASVNDENFLNDSSGSRRFGVIKVEAIHDHRVDMQQLWAEVWEIYESGEQWWLDKDTENEMQGRNVQHMAIIPIEDAILSKFDWDKPKTLWTHRMTFTMIYQSCFDKKPNKPDLNAIKPFLEKLGVQIIKPKNVNTALMPAMFSDNYHSYDD